MSDMNFKLTPIIPEYSPELIYYNSDVTVCYSSIYEYVFQHSFPYTGNTPADLDHQVLAVGYGTLVSVQQRVVMHGSLIFHPNF